MERRRKRNRKRKLLILLIALFFTTVMFATTTYAWFTANQTVKVSTLTVNVEAKDGIQISVDGTNWKSIIQTGDITTAHNSYAGSTNQLPEILEPVSTIGTVDQTGKMEMFYGQVVSNDNGDYILTATKDEETRGTNGRFITFDLFFKVNGETPVFLSTASGVRAEDDEHDTGIKNASRIALINLGNSAPDSGDEVSDIQAMGQNMTASEAAAVDPIIWEPNYNVHTTQAIAHARDTYGETITASMTTPVPYSGVKAAIASTDGILLQVDSATDYTTDHSAFFDTVSVDKLTKAGAGFDENLALMTLSPGVTKVRVYMWVEGQDVDCENSASGGEINYDLVITTLSE